MNNKLKTIATNTDDGFEAGFHSVLSKDPTKNTNLLGVILDERLF